MLVDLLDHASCVAEASRYDLHGHPGSERGSSEAVAETVRGQAGESCARRKPGVIRLTVFGFMAPPSGQVKTRSALTPVFGQPVPITSLSAFYCL